MATNNIMTAKNTFGEGLIMDFAPDNTLANTLTSALNATLLTFNGNEMSLQNDMGNGRVETARLPEGYIPMGSCEFGGIIYIISYNPLINKSLIGCFPSPERNITQDEIQNEIESSEVNWDSFQESNESGLLTGKLKAQSLKKVLISKNINPGDLYIIYTDEISEGNKKCLSDYGNSDKIHGRFPKFLKIHVVSLEDSGKITYLDSETKWYNTNYYIKEKGLGVQIKDDLDSYRSLVDSAYSVFQNKVSGKLALLFELESINSFSCTYSIYETPPKANNLVLDNSIKYKNYSIYLNTSWESDNPDINPQGLVLLDSSWKDNKIFKYKEEQQKEGESSGIYIPSTESISVDIPFKENLKKEDGVYQEFTKYDTKRNYTSYESFKKECYKTLLPNIENKKLIALRDHRTGAPKMDINDNTEYSINRLTETGETFYDDSIIVNYLHLDVIKYMGDISIPDKQQLINKASLPLNKDNLVWDFTVAPSMPYGVLENLKVNQSIDFSKINSGEINLTGWRYYNKGLTSTLTFDLECYPKLNHEIKEVVFLFYDNQGFAAAYHVAGKSSYSGTFTEIIELNKKHSSYKLNNINYLGETPTHKGLNLGDGSFEDDCGTLYANILYKVLIVVKSCPKDSTGKMVEDTSDYRYFSRWYYTFELFNDNYYKEQVKDFNILQPELTYDVSASIESKIKEHKYSLYENSEEITLEGDLYKSLGANVYHINQDDLANENGNLKLKINTGLLEDFGVFNLYQTLENSKIKVDVTLGDSSILIPTDIKLLSDEEVLKNESLLPKRNDNLNVLDDLGLNTAGKATNIGNELKKLINSNTQNVNPLEIYDKDGYANYVDTFSINFVTKYKFIDSTKEDPNIKKKPEPFRYFNSLGQEKTLEKYVQYTSDALNVLNTGIDLTLTGIMYNKFIYSNIDTNSEGILVKSIINQGPLETYGLHLAHPEGKLEKPMHLYFNNVQTIHMGESGGKDTRWGGYYKSNLATGWQSDVSNGLRNASHNAWNPSIDNGEILNIFSNVSSYLTPVVICKDTSSNAKIEGVVVSRDCKNSILKYVTGYLDPFKSNKSIYISGGNQYVPNTWLSTDTKYTDMFLVNLLCFRDPETGLVEITNDPFLTSFTNLKFVKNSLYGARYTVPADLPYLEDITQADLLGSIYSLLYSMIPLRKSFSYKNNLTYLSKFNEIWQKDLILNVTTEKDLETGSVDMCNSLLLNKFSLSEYITKINNNFITDIKIKEPSKTNIKIKEASGNNIIFKINSCQKTIDFQLAIEYNIEDYRLLQVNTSSSRTVNLISYKKTGNTTLEISSTVYGDVHDNTLYTLEGNELLPLSHASSIKIISEWDGEDNKVIPIFYNKDGNEFYLKSNLLCDVFTVKNGFLQLSNFKNHPNYHSKFNLTWWGTGDDPGILNLSGGSILNIIKI